MLQWELNIHTYYTVPVDKKNGSIGAYCNVTFNIFEVSINSSAALSAFPGLFLKKVKF